jgi:hypothetical protein
MRLCPQILVEGFAADVEVTGDPCFLLTRCNPLAKFGSLLSGQRWLAAFIKAFLLGNCNSFALAFLD